MSSAIVKNPTKELFERPEVQNKFKEMLGKRATAFITSVLQITTQNKLLANADPMSIYHSAAVAATLDLPINPALGMAFIVPYNQSYKDEAGQWQKKQVATFQIGWKGFVQLAQRSGTFKTIAATPVTKGQLKSENPLLGYEFDFTYKGEENAVVGYAAYFRLLNGFEKVLYMSIDELKRHGSKYSKSYDKGLWSTDFDSMAIKTVIKLILSKFAPLSVDMQRAVITDQAWIKDADTMDIEYVDNDGHPEEIAIEELQELFDLKKDSMNPDDVIAAARILKNKEVNSYSKLHKILSSK